MSKGSVTVVIVGVNQIILDIYGLSARLEEKICEAIKESGREVRRVARLNAPVDTGFMKSHIEMKFIKADLIAKVSYMGWAYYGKFPEFGTSKQRAHPFLGPAWAEEKPHFIDRIKDAAGDACKK